MRFLLLIISLSVSITLYGQNTKQTNVTLSVNIDTVGIDDHFILEVTYQNIKDNGSLLKSLEKEGISILQSISTSNSMSIINGVRSSEKKEKLLVKAKQIGSLKIKPIHYNANDQTIKTNMVEVFVQSGNLLQKPTPKGPKKDRKNIKVYTL